MEMVLKTCACGCGSTWKALASSPNKYANYRHEIGFVRFPTNISVPQHVTRPRRAQRAVGRKLR